MAASPLHKRINAQNVIPLLLRRKGKTGFGPPSFLVRLAVMPAFVRASPFCHPERRAVGSKSKDLVKSCNLQL